MLTAKAREDGAVLDLTVSNVTDHQWPDVAAIVPCFTPGLAPSVTPSTTSCDEQQSRTWYMGLVGLQPLVKRDIHFNRDYRRAVDECSSDGVFEFSDKWPSSDQNAAGGLLVRESSDEKWVVGIAWESYLSLQGHNPWRCMHRSVRVGPLDPGETRHINGRIYLFKGTREDCLARRSSDARLQDGG